MKLHHIGGRLVHMESEGGTSAHWKVKHVKLSVKQHRWKCIKTLLMETVEKYRIQVHDWTSNEPSNWTEELILQVWFACAKFKLNNWWKTFFPQLVWIFHKGLSLSPLVVSTLAGEFAIHSGCLQWCRNDTSIVFTQNIKWRFQKVFSFEMIV